MLPAACACSGSLHDDFVAALQQHRPEVLEQVEAARAAKARKAEESHRLASLFKTQNAGACVQAPAAAAADQAAASTAGGGTGVQDGQVWNVEPAAAPAATGFSFGFSFGK